MNGVDPLRAILVDPSLYTAPYDAALTDGLVAAGIEPTWAVRPTRRGDTQAIASRYVDAFFYRHVDRWTWLPETIRKSFKALSHAWGLLSLAARVRRHKPYIVHFQWTVIPAMDALAMLLIRRYCPVVLTVHDTTPFNGDRLTFGLVAGGNLPMRTADRIIVHTHAARQALVQRGAPLRKLSVIPHGPLQLSQLASRTPARIDQRWTFVLFGELKPYKGIDLLIEAIALLPESQRHKARFVVAGRPRMDLRPLRARVAQLGLEGVIEWRAQRHSEQAMADLFDETNCFVFPYRQVDASGVYFLVKSLSKWMIACDVGIFAEDLKDGTEGVLVPVADSGALAAALERAIKLRPTPSAKTPGADWTAIGLATRVVYNQAQGGTPCR